METTVRRIAGELGVQEEQVEMVLRLLGEGATSPFLARYRKEVTGGLDIARLRAIEERLQQVRELDERRAFVIKAVAEQQRLTPELQTAVATADTRARLEDLYLPFKQKRKSRAHQAREAGLEPLADALLADPATPPPQAADSFVNPEKGVPDRLAALDGARWILLERFSEDPELLDALRRHVREHAILQSKVVEGRQERGAKFAELFAFAEPVQTISSNRVLALFRGRKEGVLRLALVLPSDTPAAGPPAAAAPPELPGPEASGEDQGSPVEGQAVEAAPPVVPSRPTEPVREPPSVPEQLIASHFGVRQEGRGGDAWLLDTVRRAWKMKIFPYVQVEIEGQLRERAEREVIHLYARSLR
ncbi:MAG: RNA-binding transcriptional accessory protein, partial [Acidobacteria bacterium]